MLARYGLTLDGVNADSFSNFMLFIAYSVPYTSFNWVSVIYCINDSVDVDFYFIFSLDYF